MSSAQCGVRNAECQGGRRARRAAFARRFGVLLVTAGLLAPRVGAQQPAQDTTQRRGPRAATLVLELDGKPLTDWVTLRETDSLVLTVRARDSAGNAVPIWGFEAQVWDQAVLELVGTEVQSSQAIVRLAPRKRGQTTITLRCSGVRSWVLAEYRGAEIAISPGQAQAPVKRQGTGMAWWTVGARASVAFYNYSFNNDTTFAGRAGFVGELFGGREWSSGLVLVGGLGFGIVSADSVTTSVTASLVQLYARMDYAFMRQNKVRPVVSLGAGAYRIRTGNKGAGIWNTSIYWMAGAGADMTLSPKVTGEARVMFNDLWEENSKFVNGHVGHLITVGVGARMRLP
jgi:Outer membrane protein beta-barrel domain